MREAHSRVIPGSGCRARLAPSSPLGGSCALPASTPGLEGLPRPQLSREGRWSGGRYLGAVLQRLLQQQLVYGRHDAARRGRGLDRRAEGGRRGRRGCSGLRRRGRRSVPVAARARPRLPRGRRRPPARGPSSQPSPAQPSPPRSRINRKCGRRTPRPPEVRSPASAAPALRGEPQTLAAPWLLSEPLRCQSRWGKGSGTYAGQCIESSRRGT